MNPKTKNPGFAEILLRLSDKHNQLNAEYEKHPTLENKVIANSIRLEVIQLGKIMFEKADDQIWN